MRRAIFIALGIGVMVTSAAALDIAGATRVTPALASFQDDSVHAARTRDSARAERRSRIEARYVAERELCAGLSGYRRDKCLVKAHANRGRAMLEAATLYETRF